MAKKIGVQTYKLDNPVYIVGRSSIVGDKEAKGPLSKYFLKSTTDDTMGEATYEKSERSFMQKAISFCLKNSKLNNADIDILIGGDLLNQIVTTNYTAEKFGWPYIGVYSACSIMSESLAVAACLLDANVGKYIMCVTGSHFASAERQFRGPLELASQRQTYSQWTVTAMGATILGKQGKGPKITHVCFGKVVNYGVKDIANMGAAMAPAAMETLVQFFLDTKTSPNDYDLIITGDLGKFGSDVLKDLLLQKGFKVGKNFSDCGHIIYDASQKTFQGGSGAGCSASVLNSYIVDKMEQKVFRKVIFMPTGALMSTTSNQQGDSIPCISHLILLEI